MRRLIIGGPTLATVPAAFAFDLAQLYATTLRVGPWSGVTLGFIASTYVHVGRETFLEGAIARQASDVLWLDTDMRFPADAAIRLAQRDRPIVACNCRMRDPRILFTAQRDGQVVVTDVETSTGLEVVDSVGLAVMLMRTDVVAGLPQPWFPHGRTAAGRDVGEDMMFCRALRAAGREIVVDHDLSKEIGHIGLHTYRP